MNKITIKEKLDAEKNVEPVLVDKDNGTQTFEDTKMEKVTAPEVIEGAAKMDNIDPEEDNVDYIETPVVVREKRIISEKLDKAGYKKVLADLKENNPKKYEAKKEELERKIKALDEK